MRLSPPALTIVAFLAAAALVLGGGLRMARREREVRVVPDRTALREFARALQGELARLDAVYLADLREAAERIRGANPDTIRKVCAEFAGIRAASELRAQGSGASTEVRIDALDTSPLPHVELTTAGRAPSQTDALALPRSVVFAADGNRLRDGWISESRQSNAVFWSRRDDATAIVLTVDRAEVAAVESAWLRHWAEPRFAGVLATRGLDRIEAPAGRQLAGLEEAPERAPDFVIPLTARLGDWQAVSWDRFEMRSEHEATTLGVATASAAALVFAGLLIARQQARSQRLAEQRVSFVNRVSHELGAPLTNMLLNLDLAQEALETEPAETARRLSVIREEAQRLGRLVANVLTFSRRERRTLKLQPAPCHPGEVVSRVLEQFGPSLERHGISIERIDGTDQPLFLDADALAQIVANLVSNVEKYAAEGRYLGLETSHSGQHLVLRAADRGPGVPPAARSRIFEPFERVTNRVSEGATGTGLGLSIARELATLMGGTLQLVPSEQGAVFELRVPAPAV
jgi:signal transduction histidine kinase